MVSDLPSTVTAEDPAEEKAADPSTQSIIESEAKLVRDVLEQCDWNKTLAAERLGISRSTLYQKIKKYQINGKPTLH